jgi:hypothetical protein
MATMVSPRKRTRDRRKRRAKPKPAPKPAKRSAAKPRARSTKTATAKRSRATRRVAVRGVAPFRLDVVSFNTHGAVDRSGQVQSAVGPFLQRERPLVACFQELFFRDSLEELDRVLLGAPVVLEQAAENLELARGSIGGAYRRRVAWVEENVVGAGAGLAIYTSFPFKNAKFYRFDGLAVPDQFSIKGVLKIEMTVAGFSFALATTHFNDSENDMVDGRARRANIDTVRRMVEDVGDLPIVLVGDFNINAAAKSGLDVGLFERLLAAGGRRWVEAGMENARQNGLAIPVPTVAGGRACIDFLLGSAPNGRVRLAAGSYRARDPFKSDHRLVRATLELS